MLPSFYTYLLPLEKITTFSTAKVKHRYWVVIYLSLSNLLKTVVYEVAFDPVIEIPHMKDTALCPVFDPLVHDVIIVVSNNRTCKNISFNITMYNIYLLPTNTEKRKKNIHYHKTKKHLSYSVIPVEKVLNNILQIQKKKILTKTFFFIVIVFIFSTLYPSLHYDSLKNE